MQKGVESFRSTENDKNMIAAACIAEKKSKTDFIMMAVRKLIIDMFPEIWQTYNNGKLPKGADNGKNKTPDIPERN